MMIIYKDQVDFRLMKVYNHLNINKMLQRSVWISNLVKFLTTKNQNILHLS